MPNIGSLLREEISRLARKELRTQVEGLRKASTQHRHTIASLKRQVSALERQVASLEKKAVNAPAAQSTAGNGEAQRVRFVAKGLRSQRERLGLSAAEYGKLVGVSAQSVYNWEHEMARPRGKQLTIIAALRGVGKRQVQARLAELNGQAAKPRRKS